MCFVVWVNETSIKFLPCFFLVQDFKFHHCGEQDTKHNINMYSKWRYKYNVKKYYLVTEIAVIQYLNSMLEHKCSSV